MITSPCPCWTSASVPRCFGTGWPTQPCFVLCFSMYFTVLLLVLRLVSVAVLWLLCLLLAMLFCLMLAVLFCLMLASLFSVLFILSPLLDDERSSATASSLRCFLAVLVPVLLYFVLLATRSLAVVLFRILTTGSLAVSVSDPLQRQFVVVCSFLDASPAPPTPLLSIAPFVIVGSR